MSENKMLRKFKLDQQGQMILVVPLVIVLSVGAALLWGYLQMTLRASSNAKNATVLNQLFQSIEKRMVSVLTGDVQPNNAATGYTSPGTCDAMLNTSNILGNYLTGFRNFSPGFFTPGPPANNEVKVTLTSHGNTLGPSNPLGLVGWVGCVVSTTEMPLSYAQNLSITIDVKVLSADPISGSTTVSISISGSIQMGTAGSPSETHTLSQISQYRLHPASLKSYAIVLASPIPGPTVSNPTRIEVISPAVAHVVGSVYYDNSINPAITDIILMPAAGASPSLIIEKQLDIRGPSVGGTTAIDMNLLKTMYRNGFNTGVLYGGILPTEDNGDLPHSAWEVNLDYSVTGSTASGPYVYVLPDLNPVVSPYPGPGVTLQAAFQNVPGAPLVYPYTPQNAVYCGTGGSAPCAATPTPGTTNTIPDDNLHLALPPAAGTDKRIASLGTSCPFLAPLPNTFNTPFVFVRSDQDLTINFNLPQGALLNPPPPLSDAYFCGLVRARNVIISNPSTTPVFVIGQIIAETIQITGNGPVIFTNPIDQMGLVAQLNSTIDQSTLVNQLEQAATTYGQPFFVPMYAYMSPTPAPTIAAFRPHGPIVGPAASPTPPPCIPSSPAENCVGYVSACFYPPPPGAPVVVETNSVAPYVGDIIMCLTQTNTPPIPQYDANLKFVASRIF